MPFFTQELVNRLQKKNRRFPSLLELQNEGPEHKFYQNFNEEEQRAIQEELRYFPKLQVLALFRWPLPYKSITITIFMFTM